MSAGAKPLTGRKVLAIVVAAFAVIIAANMAMLLAATGSFPGLVVKNSYVASQSWDARTAAQRALGWKAAVGHDGGALTVAIRRADGTPVRGLAVTAVVGRPASDAEDVSLALEQTGDVYAAPLEPGPGQWRVAVTARDGAGAHFEAGAGLRLEGRR